MDELILQFLEGIRNPVLTNFLGIFSLIGEATVISGIIILVFWLAPRRAGEQLLMTVMTSYPLNSYIKFTVARPRPYIDGAVSKLEPPFGTELSAFESFPSGHTQMTTSFFGAVVSTSRKVLVWILCFFVVALIAFARMYFGVHYPSDVLIGFLIGAVFALLWALIFRVSFEYRYLFLLGYAAVALIPVLFAPSHEYLQAAGLLAGTAVSLPLLHFTATYKDAAFPRRIWRVPVGAVILAATYLVTLFFPAGEAYHLWKWFLLALAGIFACRQVFEILQI